jgi:hypothetical protein
MNFELGRRPFTTCHLTPRLATTSVSWSVRHVVVELHAL